MRDFPVIKNYAYCLVHVPDLVRYGSKPRREISKDPEVESLIKKHLREYVDVLKYAPNQVFVGSLTPDDLGKLPRPWFDEDNLQRAFKQAKGEFGEIADQKIFYALLKIADVLNPPLVEFTEKACEELIGRLQRHCLIRGEGVKKLKPTPENEILEKISSQPRSVLPLLCGEKIVGCVNRDNRAEGKEDENLEAHHLLENLCTKASGALVLRWLFRRENIEPEEIDCIITCGEESCGDRYQRGGGGMAKAMGEMAGCINASGIDVKNFCAAPASAIIIAAGLIASGIYKNIAVVGGGSLSKLGMKFQGLVKEGTPILDDCLGAMAFLISENDNVSPVIRLDAIGKMPISAGTTDEKIYQHILLEPLENIGLKITDIDKYAVELQNPEIMVHSGAGDVAEKNYENIAFEALEDALDSGSLGSEDEENSFIDDFVKKRGMVGFAPTQGHIPSAVPYLGHAVEEIKSGKIKRAMFLSKASLFLSRCTLLYDGVSFIVEENPNAKKKKINIGSELRQLKKQSEIKGE